MTQQHRPGTRVRVDSMAVAAPGYDIVVRFGALDELGERVAAAAPADAYAVITPHSLQATIGARAVAELHRAGLHVELLAFDDAEVNKTRETWSALTDRMLDLRHGRDSCVVAVGGGVTGDVAGFVAATYMRGVPFVQVPTTLLSMIDASIGGKTGVDTPAGKNLVGAFHSPAVVVIDPAALQTLPPPHIRSGLAEAVKHGAILDAAYFEWIASNVSSLLALDPASLEQLIARSITLKADIVSADPLEDGRRAILNFGHTVGHALERYTGYSMSHGAAVSVGMCAEAALGEELGCTAPGTADALRALLTTVGLPVTAAFDPAALVETMTLDKKSRATQPRFALLRSIGECAPDTDGRWTHSVDSQALIHVLQQIAGARHHV